VKCFGKVESEDGEEKEPKADEALDIIARALGKEREEY
jgi:hemerythrin superfamily protein